MALTAGGQVYGWGIDAHGEIGNGSHGGDVVTPSLISGLGNVVAIAAGMYHGCAVSIDGTMRCWGWNTRGGIGDGTTLERDTPTSVVTGGGSPLSNVVAISAGTEDSCANLATGMSLCWGYGYPGMLGDGTTSDAYTPALVSGETTLFAIAAGQDHTCAMEAGGLVKCFGSNTYGAYGNGSTTSEDVPDVATLGSWATMSAGQAYSCGVDPYGNAQCFGFNGSGTLGNGSTTNVDYPVFVQRLALPPNTTGATAIAAGSAHTCAFMKGTNLFCWGFGGYGQLGSGSTSTPTPIEVSSF
jgi:alpha-tubulin suppressor-like RCC1 family protein